MKAATEEHFEVPKSIGFDTPEKQQKKCTKKSGFDFWDVPKFATTFWNRLEVLLHQKE